MATIDLIDVSKNQGSTQILQQVNISIQKGEFVVVVGPSGCGKSTLLRLISGLDSISSGKILINNQCVNEVPAAKRDMAMVFQNYALYPHMTVFDNMAYGLKMRGFNKVDIVKRVKDTAQLLQLTPYLDRKPQALSGGQKQRVAMGRAIVRSPSVFLFDEPLSNLDAKLRTEMRHEIRKLHQQLNTTSLYVTHDQTEAMTMAERILVLHQGVVEQIGSPQDLYQNPATLFVAGFTGHYPINYLSGIWDKKTATIKTDLGIDYPIELNMKSVVDKEELVFAVRAEHMFFCQKDDEQAIAVTVEFIDNMGADKMIQVLCHKNAQKLHIRVPAEYTFNTGPVHIRFLMEKGHLFYQKTGKRIGG